MVIEHRDAYESEWEAMRSIAAKLGIGTTETLRKWVRQAEVDDGRRDGVTTAERERIRQLERENRELRRANEILRKASAYFSRRRSSTAHEGDGRVHQRSPPRLRGRVDHGSVADRSVDVLRCSKARQADPSPRARRDRIMRGHVRRIWQTEQCVYGARKVWHELRREGHQVARCTVERLMRQMGLEGVRRGRAWTTTTDSDPRAGRPADLVDRDFAVAAPNRLWVADYTFVATWRGFVSTAFVIDAYARRIVGWRCSTHQRTESCSTRSSRPSMTAPLMGSMG